MLIVDTSEVMDYIGGTPTPIIDPAVVPDLLSGAEQSGIPEIHPISEIEWSNGSIPQNTVPFTRDGGTYLMQVDEYGGCSGSPAQAGAARIIDITDEAAPYVLSNMRLEVHNDEFFDEICDDPGAPNPLQTYSAHYCHIPSRVDPMIVACSMNLSGLRVFDISNLANPIETAYFNAPVQPRPVFELVPQDTLPFGITFEASNWAMSAPAFVPERNEIWYSDAFQGFFAVRLTNGAWPYADDAAPVPAPTSEPAPTPTAELPATGSNAWLRGAGVAALLGAALLSRPRRRGFWPR